LSTASNSTLTRTRGRTFGGPLGRVGELEALFKSASLETQYGTPFDQRHIDYFVQNFERIDEMHCRKFEALTSEYFDKQGWRVEIPPGASRSPRAIFTRKLKAS
jgi:hypothetical protein